MHLWVPSTSRDGFERLECRAALLVSGVQQENERLALCDYLVEFLVLRGWGHLHKQASPISEAFAES